VLEADLELRGVLRFDLPDEDLRSVAEAYALTTWPWRRALVRDNRPSAVVAPPRRAVRRP
jgi:hypothetical protein